MKKILLLFYGLLLSIGTTWAQTPTWSDNVASILYANCTNCHHTGGVAPFSLIDYTTASNLSTDIQNAINNKTMPPWPPDPTYKPLAHERVLSAADVQTINDWVQAGAPQGNLQNAPTPPTYNNQPEITNPDLVSTMPTYTSTASTNDIYRCFVMPSNINTVSYITGIELIPGNGNIVHHVLIFQDSTNQPAQLDTQDPLPGYTSFGGTGSNNSKLIGAWVPGQRPVFYPSGMGVRLAANTNIVLQVHYPAGSAGQSDATQVRFKLTTAPSRQLFIAPVLNHGNIQNGTLTIPANTTKTFTEQYTTPAINISLLSVAPHMHLIGRNIKVYGVTTQNDTLPYIHIPNWDFHWQGGYMFKTIQKIPPATKLRAEAFYDNTVNNPSNPNSPPQTVSAGEATTDEMMLVYFTYTFYLPGDENISLEQSSNTAIIDPTKYLNIQVYPNPSENQIHIVLPDFCETAKVKIIDAKGSIAKMFEIGRFNSLDISDLPTGQYTIWVNSQQKSGYVKWLKQ